MDNLTSIRTRIGDLDRELMDLIAERVQLAADAGELKRDRGVGPRDFVVERAVVDRYRQGFTDRDLLPDAGERVANELFTETLRVQEEAARATVQPEPGHVLLVGGAGRMGSWFARYFEGLGHEVTIYDPGGRLPGFAHTESLRDTASAVDSVVISTPPDTVEEVLDALVGIDAAIVDIASLKSPFIDTIERLAETQPIASVHPMWGPDTRVLSDKYLLVCDCGNERGTEAARELFEPTQATVVPVPLAEHDWAMAFTQVLPQALSLLFADLLSGSPFTLEELNERGGGSFSRQAEVTEAVVRSSPGVYRQIQALNDHAPEIYDRLHEALDQLMEDCQDPDAFADMLHRYRHFFDGQMEGRHP